MRSLVALCARRKWIVLGCPDMPPYWTTNEEKQPFPGSRTRSRLRTHVQGAEETRFRLAGRTALGRAERSGSMTHCLQIWPWKRDPLELGQGSGLAGSVEIF
jgi:hypothetical protein